MKYKYKLVKAETKQIDNTTVYMWDINEEVETEWHFVSLVPPNAMLFEKVIQDSPYTFTAPNSTGIITLETNQTK
jgi:hypothetical protein